MTGNKLRINNVRLAFTRDLYHARSHKDDPTKPKKYKCKIIVPPDHPQTNEIKQEITRCAIEAWKEQAKMKLESIKGNSQRFAWRDGNLTTWEGFPGNFYLSLARRESDGLPLYVRANPGTKEKPNLILEASHELYSGCFVNASVSFWTFDKDGALMNCNLLGLQFHSKGEAFSGGDTSSADEFENNDADSKIVQPVGADVSAFL